MLLDRRRHLRSGFITWLDLLVQCGRVRTVGACVASAVRERLLGGALDAWLAALDLFAESAEMDVAGDLPHAGGDDEKR